MTLRFVLGVVVVGLLAVLGGAARGQVPEGALLDALLVSVTHPDEDIRKDALRRLGQLGDRRALPALIDLLRFDFAADLDMGPILDGLSGQTLGTDWAGWMEWLEQQKDLKPHPGYRLWKSALYKLIDPAFAEFLHPGVKSRIRLEEIAWGGVRKDGIPALVNPKHVRADAASYLSPDELVFGVSVKGDHRAYPLRIMDWHEMVNDVVGGTPIAVAY